MKNKHFICCVLCLVLIISIFGGCKEAKTPDISSVPDVSVVSTSSEESVAQSEIESISETQEELSQSENSYGETVNTVTSQQETEQVESVSIATPGSVVSSDVSSTPKMQTIQIFDPAPKAGSTQEVFNKRIKDDSCNWYYIISENDVMKPVYYEAYYIEDDLYAEVGSICFVTIQYRFNTTDFRVVFSHPWPENEKQISAIFESFERDKSLPEITLKTVTYNETVYEIATKETSPDVVSVYWTYDGLPFRAVFYDNSFTEDMLKYLKLEKVDLEK